MVAFPRPGAALEQPVEQRPALPVLCVQCPQVRSEYVGVTVLCWNVAFASLLASAVRLQLHH